MNSTELEECEVTGKMSIENVQKLLTDTTVKKMGIYGLQNKIKPEKWYIGQSVDIFDRWKTAYENVSCKTQPKIYRALKKYGIENFNKIVLEECEKESLSEKEIKWINIYRSNQIGYNLTAGGSGGNTRQGRKNNRDHRKRISESKKGKVFTEAHKKALSDAWKRRTADQIKKCGRVFTDDEKNHLRNLRKGKKLTDEQKQKISQGLIKYNMSLRDSIICQ